MVSKVLLASLVTTACASQDAAASEQCTARAGGSCGGGLSRDSALLQARFTHAGAQGAASREEDNWMLDTTLDREWLAGGTADDATVAALPAAEKALFVEAAHHAADAILQEGEDEAAEDREIWVKKFDTVHQAAVKTLGRHPTWATSKPDACRRHPGAGGISGLYTFGGPGTALSSLTNPRASDGKFPGMRVVNQRLETVRGKVRAYHDPVGFFAGMVCLQHPHMDLLLLPANHTPTMHGASKETSRIPTADMGFWVKGHHQDIYRDSMHPHRHDYDYKIYEMMHLSRAVDPSISKYDRDLTIAEASIVGWNLVGQSKSTKLHWFDIIPMDNTSLFQDPVSKACALAFVPTHAIPQWLANLRFTPVSFCGIPNVHKGFRNQLRRAIRSPMWAEQLAPKLVSCPKLYLAGHSLGAGQAQLLAACLQRAPAEGEDGWKDYKLIRWVPGKAQALPAIASSVGTAED